MTRVGIYLVCITAITSSTLAQNEIRQYCTPDPSYYRGFPVSIKPVRTIIYQIWDTGAWVNLEHEVLIFDSNERRTQHISEDWFDDRWDLYRRYSSAYEGDLEVQRETSYWSGEAWGDAEQRWLFSYDENGQLDSTILQFLTLDQWESNWKYSSSCSDSGLLISQEKERFYEGEWIPTNRIVHTYNSADSLTEALVETWEESDSTWRNGWRTRYERADSVRVVISEVWSETGNEWEMTEQVRDTQTRSTNGVLLRVQTDAWNGQTWFPQRRVNFTYNENGLLAEKMIQTYLGSDQWSAGSEILFFYDQDGDIIEEMHPGFERWLYGYMNATGVEPISEAEKSRVRVYPNPSRDLLRVKASLPSSNAVSLRVFDIIGRQMHQVGLQPSAELVDYELATSALAPGVYILVLTQSEFSKSVPVVVVR